MKKFTEKKHIKQLILQIVLVICIVSVVIFAGMLTRELLINQQSQSFYAGLLSNIETYPRNPGQGGQGNGSTDPGGPGLHGDHRDLRGEWRPYVDFDVLNERFPGITAWIKSPNGEIDYPVMQHTNNTYFLGRLPDGSDHRSGSIFMDYRSSSDFSDKSILIYGHESHEKEMFGSLKHYRNQTYFAENPVIYLYTPFGDFEIVIFAVHLAHSQRDYPPINFASDDAFLEYIEHIRSISLINSDVKISAGEQIVSLCTCAYDFDEARLVVVGVLR